MEIQLILYEIESLFESYFIWNWKFLPNIVSLIVEVLMEESYSHRTLKNRTNLSDSCVHHTWTKGSPWTAYSFE